MLKEVDKKTWQEAVSINRTSIFDDPDYLEIIAQLHHTDIKYWVFYKKNKSILGFATYVKGNIIVVPDHYSYSSFWFNDELTDFSFFDVLDQSLKVLKGGFKNFSFRLPPQVKDVRAFNLNGCSSVVNYTYYNATSQLELRKNNEAKFKESLNYDLAFFYDEYNELVLEQQLNDFQNFGYKKSKINFYRKYFKELIDRKYLKSFGVFFEGTLKASALVIIDQNNATAYNLLLSNSKMQDKTDSSTFLYVKIIEKLKELGIQKFDLYGANMKGIANFKSGFRGDLIPHYIVKYSSLRNSLNKFLMFAKRVVKKMAQ
nr:hypothetical protein [Pseudopedobacter sp.]